MVPEELTCEGRIGVAVEERVWAMHNLFEQTLHTLAEVDLWLREHPVEIGWTGGQFESAARVPDHPPRYDSEDDSQ